MKLRSGTIIEMKINNNVIINENQIDCFDNYQQFILSKIVEFNNINSDTIDEYFMKYNLYPNEIIPNHFIKFSLECIILTCIYDYVTFDFDLFFKTFMKKNESAFIDMMFIKSIEFENKINMILNTHDFHWDDLSIIKNIKLSLQKYKSCYTEFV
jgi:hypothetical protein